MANVYFRIGAFSAYEALATKDPYSFYYAQDTKQLFLGDNEITSVDALAAVVADVAQNTSDIANIQTVLARLDGNEYIDGSVKNLIKAAVDSLNVEIAKKTTQEIISAEGRAMIFNEADGGGAKFEHVDGSWSFVGVNNGGENGLAGQLYVVKQDDGKYVGTRLNMTKDGFYYLPRKNSSAYTSDDEIAVKGDLTAKQNKTLDTPIIIDGSSVTTVEGALVALNNSSGGGGDASSKTVYLVDESAGQQEYSKIFSLYQGANSSDMSQNVFVGRINIPLSQVLRYASVVTLVYSVGRLLDNGVDVTRLVKGEGVPATLADAGKYMKFEMQNVDDPIYVAMQDFVDILTTNNQTSEITLAIDANNNITGTIGEIVASKILFEIVGGTSTTVQHEIEELKTELTWQGFES